jgi:DNA polymerase-1
MPPILYLIDGHALAYRTFFALTAGGGERWQTRAGETTAGVYGFASVLLRLLVDERPDYLAVAFDTGKTFRDELFAGYKATRAKMPEDLRSQMGRIRELVDAFGFPRLEMEGYEADDVLGSIAHQAAAQGLGVKIITGDRDLLQLVTERISVNLAGGKLSEAEDYTTAEDVKKKLGVFPGQVVDYKGLVGDKSDNIPGVQGVGEKTATELFNTYQDLEAIYSHLEDLPARVRTRLETGRVMAFLSRDLATIHTNLHMTLDLEAARTDHIKPGAVEQLFRTLEFRSLIDRLHSLTPQSPMLKQQLSLFESAVPRVGEPPILDNTQTIVDDVTSLDRLLGELAAFDSIAVDTETTSTDPLQGKIVGISLAVRPGEGYYIPLGHNTGETQLPIGQVVEALCPVFSHPQKHFTGHNLKFDCLVLQGIGLIPMHLDFDSMIAEWLVDPGSRRLGLKDMADGYLALEMTHIEDLIGKGKGQITMAEVPVNKVAPYAASDAEVTLRLRPILEKKLSEVNASNLFNEIEMPLIPVLCMMERNGVALDMPFFSNMSVELQQRLAEIETSIYAQVGYSFNLNSTQQLSKVLFETLKLQPPDPRKKTASGYYSTSAEVLEELRGKHPAVDGMLEYRELSKLKSTYVDALPLQINPRTGRVHTSFNQAGSITGRLASSEPNLQNIPTRTDLGRRVRRGFIASQGNTLLSVDYSQIELRIVAHMSGDQAMLDAFRAGQDIHAATAAAIFGTPLENVNKNQRRHAKTINFGLIYGMSAFGLSRSTDLTLAESEDFVKAYFQQFPGVKSYLDGMRRQAAHIGYVETLLGRRRYFPNLQNHSNPMTRNREEREAINAPIQGTAADIMKIAMIHVPPALEKAGLSADLLLQVHDELVLECPPSELLHTATTVREVMENAFNLTIPLLTDARSGHNWGELQTLLD